MKHTYQKKTAAERAKELKEITEQLEKSVRDFMDGDKYRDFLSRMSLFHEYSLNNQILIHRQNPDATYCASYATWKKLDRYVKEGEKGIKIICPAPYRRTTVQDVTDETGKPVLLDDGTPKKETVEEIRTAFTIRHTFDISQTEGKPLPNLATPLEGTLDGRQRELKEALLELSPVPVTFQPIKGSTNGYYNLTKKEIVIDSSLSEQQTLKTLVHEISHALLHDTDKLPEAPKDSRTREVQAESVAYVVSHSFGLDTSGYSFGYIAGWSGGKDIKELRGSLETIRNTANEIITRAEQILCKKEMPKLPPVEAPAKKGRCL